MINCKKNEKIISILRCPICKSRMDIAEGGSGVLYCNGAKKHCYDFASSGYVNLASFGRSNAGDSKQAVLARSNFLNMGYYTPIAQKLCELLHKYALSGGLVVDAGCGEGFYSSEILKQGFCTMGFDLSKFAAEAAAKRGKRLDLNNGFFGVASVYSLPLADESADALVNIFAPCVEGEYSRILKDDGVLIVVYAGPEHLFGLKEAVYKEIHVNEERADMPVSMSELERFRLEYDITLRNAQDIQNLFSMTPYYWKTSREDFEKLCELKELTTKIDIIFSVYKKI